MTHPVAPAGSYTPRAPAELWRLVFRLATASATSYDAGYAPFEPLDEMQETSDYVESEDVRLQTCVCLMRVCRLWRLIAAEFLYEDVRIAGGRGLQSLISGLQRSQVEDGTGGFGRHVRRLELPRRQTNFSPDNPHVSSFPLSPLQTGPSAINLGDLLRYTPRLEVLVRPCMRLDVEDIYFWASLIAKPLGCESPLLPHLRRLEWFAISSFSFHP